MNNIPDPKISPDFTIVDLHIIREWNYERRQGMTRKEICDDINRAAEPIVERLASMLRTEK